MALEGALRDLSERVALLRRSGEAEPLLKPLEAMASDLRAAIREHDPQTAAASLEREIRAIGGKIDGLAEMAVNPETFERILRQTEDVRNLLAAAATRSLPLDQLERRIGDLADRVEGLSASPAPQIESAQMAASLAELRREIECSTPISTLAAIERRLEQIARRLDEEILARPTGAADPAPFEDLARRIDDVRHSVEARPQPGLDISALEASLRELTARLDRPTVESAPEAAPMIDLAPVEDALRSLNARLDNGNPAALDPQIIDRVADEIVQRIEKRGGSAPHALARQIDEIHSHLEALAERAMQPPESAVHLMIERLRESLAAPGGGGDGAARLAGELAQMRAEQANAESQTQIRLGRLQDGFETLLERLTHIESELAGEVSGGQPPRAGVGVPKSAETSPPVDTLSMLGRAPAASASPERDSAPDLAAEDFLLEPGQGATELAREARELAQAIGARTSPSVSVHIAAARRAAQAAAEAEEQKASADSAGGSLAERGAVLLATHRRSLLHRRRACDRCDRRDPADRRSPAGAEVRSRLSRQDRGDRDSGLACPDGARRQRPHVRAVPGGGAGTPEAQRDGRGAVGDRSDPDGFDRARPRSQERRFGIEPASAARPPRNASLRDCRGLSGKACSQALRPRNTSLRSA